MNGDKGRFETRQDEFLPYLGHIKPNVVANESGSVMAMISLPGLPFELDANEVRNARPHRINSLLQMVGDDNGNRGTIAGSRRCQAGCPRQRMRSGKAGTTGCPGTLSRLPR